MTRDTLGWAWKATYAQVWGEPVDIFKDPITDSGMKKSAKGICHVSEDLNLTDQRESLTDQGMLTTLAHNGQIVKTTDWETVRKNTGVWE